MDDRTEKSLTYKYLLDKYGLTISWDEAAAELGVYWENVRRLCKQGEIRAQKVGRAWLLTTKALAEYIDHGPATKTGAGVPTPVQRKRGHHKYLTID